MDMYTFHAQNENLLLDRFWELYNRFEDFRITLLTKENFHEFYDTGYKLLYALPDVLPIFRMDDKDFDRTSTFHLLIAEKLIEQCMRWDRWSNIDEIMRFIEDHCLYSISWIADMKDVIFQKHEAADCIVSFLRKHKEPCNKNKVLKENADIQRNYANWAMRFYKGIKTEKRGSASYVSCDEEFFGG